MWNEQSKEGAKFGEELTRELMKELQALLNNFSSVFSDKPGRTNMAEHSIITEQTIPVRRPPYRLPQAYKELVKMSWMICWKMTSLRLQAVSGHRQL